MDVSQDQLKQLLIYNKNTGEFTWKVRPTHMFPSTRACNSWNTRYSNKIAGTDGLFNGKYYRVIRINGSQYLAHRIAWVFMNGTEPNEIDHIDSDGLNNKWANIRNVTHRDNCKNTRLGTKNTSGVVGVHWCNRDEKWIARINDNGKTICLGYFSKLKDAKKARKIAENNYGYHINHGTKKRK